MIALAGRLLSDETGGKSAHLGASKAAAHFIEELRPVLSTLMGNGGFRALLSRAVALTRAEIPGLNSLNVKADGSLEGWEQSEGEVTPDELSNGSAVLLAQLFGLLVAFVGVKLTLRLVSEVRPSVSLEDLKIIE